MHGRILLKHSLKHSMGWMAVGARALGAGASPGRVAILMYHRIAPPSCRDLETDDWNVSPARFERQIAWLAANAECVPVAQVPTVLRSRPGARPWAAVTFDDGYASFRTHALPILTRYRIPATLFVVTEFVGRTEPFPFDAWGWRNRERVPTSAWLPITWREIEESVAAGGVTIGSHSHTHPDARDCTDAQLVDEAARSREVLLRRLGEAHAEGYSYPYGSTRLGQVRPAYREAVRQGGYRWAVTTDLGLADAESENLLLPRVEVHSWDGPAIVGAKIHGSLLPFQLTDRLRSPARARV